MRDFTEILTQWATGEAEHFPQPGERYLYRGVQVEIVESDEQKGCCDVRFVDEKDEAILREQMGI